MKLRRRIAAKRDDANFLVGKLPDFLGDTAEPRKIAVVRDHEYAVFGKLDIRLEVIRTRGNGRPRRSQCVFQRLGRDTAMGMNTDAVHFRECLKRKPRTADSEK